MKCVRTQLRRKDGFATEGELFTAATRLNSTTDTGDGTANEDKDEDEDEDAEEAAQFRCATRADSFLFPLTTCSAGSLEVLNTTNAPLPESEAGVPEAAELKAPKAERRAPDTAKNSGVGIASGGSIHPSSGMAKAAQSTIFQVSRRAAVSRTRNTAKPNPAAPARTSARIAGFATCTSRFVDACIADISVIVGLLSWLFLELVTFLNSYSSRTRSLSL